MSWKSCSASVAASVAVGSSKIITFARCANAPATATSCCFSPGLSDRTGRSVAIRKSLREQRPPLGWSL